MRSFISILAFLPLSFSLASGFIIGKAIGEGDIPTIKYYYRVSVLCSFVMACIFVFVLWAAKPLIFSMYTKSSDTRVELEKVWPLILLYAFFDVI